jgi:hypothetical protein
MMSMKCTQWNRQGIFLPLKIAFQRTSSVVICLLALIGFLDVMGGFLGSPVVLPFNSLGPEKPELMKQRYLSLTLDIDKLDSPEAHWRALQPALSLLNAIQPDIAQWMVQLNREKRMLWKPLPTLFNWPVLASYDWRLNYFYLGPEFWKLNEGDKAAVIAHEYFHHRQNKPWMLGDTMLETVTGKLSEYGSRTEDEAHLFQLAAYQAMGMQPSGIVTGYFRQRHLYRFVSRPPASCRFD